MRALPLLLLGALLLGGCAGDPTPRAASATAAAPPAEAPAASSASTAEPVPDRVFTLPSTTATANADFPPRAVAVRPDADCISAEWTGTIGNCLAPSIAVHDTCGKVDYVIYYNDCASSGIDTRYLTDSGKPPARVYRAPAGGASVSARWEAVAIRGTINKGMVQMSNATFDVEVDFLNATANGAPLTVHLVGATSR